MSQTWEPELGQKLAKGVLKLEAVEVERGAVVVQQVEVEGLVHAQHFADLDRVFKRNPKHRKKKKEKKTETKKKQKNNKSREKSRMQKCKCKSAKMRESMDSRSRGNICVGLGWEIY